MYKYFLIFIFSIFLFSCKKEGHQVRFENGLNIQVLKLEIAGQDFGAIASGAITDYKQMPAMTTYTLFGSTSNGVLNAKFSLSGRSQNKWRIRVDLDKQIRLIQE